MESVGGSSEECDSRGHVPPADGNAKSLSESDYEACKIFAGGLNRCTTADGLKEHFSKYGQVVHSEIVADKTTGKSRGFGFVTFASDDVVKAVLAVSHKVDNVVVDVKQAVRKEKAKDLVSTRDETNRIFVGGISDTVSDEYFKNYFSRYGPVVSYNYLLDKTTNKPRGFGFVIYENVQDCEKALGPHTSLGRNCEAKKAQPRPTSSSRTPSGQFQGVPEGFDYAAYYYAQANMMYNPYFAQMYASNQLPQMAYFNQMAGGQMFPFCGNWNPDQSQDDGTKEDENTEQGNESGDYRNEGEYYGEEEEEESRSYGRERRRGSESHNTSSHSYHGPSRGNSHKTNSRAEPY